MDSYLLRQSIIDNLIDVTRTMIDTPIDLHNVSIRKGKERDFLVCIKLFELVKDEKLWTGDNRSFPPALEIRNQLDLIKFRLNLLGNVYDTRPKDGDSNES